MTTFRVLLTGAVAAAALTTAAQAAEEKKLNIYNWSDYIAEDTIANFEKETGIDVTYDVYDSNETLEAKLLAGSTGYDLVVPTGNFFQRQIQAGIYQPLDKSKLTNLGNLDPTIMKEAQAHDPDNAHGIVYMWGTNGIGYNPAKVEEVLGEDAPTDSYDLIFDPKYAEQVSKCGLYILDSPSEVIPVALQYLGLDPYSTNPEDYEKAQELLMKIRPYVTKFHSSEYINALANGDICVAMGFSGDIFIAADEAAEGVEVAYTIPKEGTAIWFDFMGILKDAPHPENAHLFLDYIMRPEVTAGITNYVWYANANAKATELVDEEVRTNPGVYPAPEVMAKLFSSKTLPQNIERVRTRVWNRVKTGQ